MTIHEGSAGAADPFADLLRGPRDPVALAPARLEVARRRARRLRSFLDAGGARLAPGELRAAAIEAVEELDAVLAATTALLEEPREPEGHPRPGARPSPGGSREERAGELEALRRTARCIRDHARAMMAEAAFSERPASDWQHLEPISRAAERMPALLEPLARSGVGPEELP